MFFSVKATCLAELKSRAKDDAESVLPSTPHSNKQHTCSTRVNCKTNELRHATAVSFASLHAWRSTLLQHRACRLRSTACG